MGPRLDSRGRPASQTEQKDENQQLQWGRGWTAAEGWVPDSLLGGNIQASMGPRLDSRGRELATQRSHGLPRASMGPRLDSRGRCRFSA